MKWTKVFLTIFILITFIVSITFIGFSQPNSQPITLYIVIPQKFSTIFNLSLPLFPTQSLINYSTLINAQGNVYQLTQLGIKTYGDYISFVLNSTNSSFSNNCLYHEHYSLCSNSSYSWELFIQNSYSQNIYSLQALNTKINTVSSPTTIVLIYAYNKGLLMP